jgi:large subunit ribosomal protein L25
VSETRMKAQTRTEFGKGAARRLRRDELVPAVIYAHGDDAVRHIALPAHELQRALKNANVLLELELDDGVQLTLPKAIQRNPVRPAIEHVDLVAVRRGEKVVVEIAVVTEGKLIPGGLIEHVNDRIAVEAEATHIPESLSATLDGVEIGDAIRAKDVVLPSGVTLVADPEQVVVHVMAAKSVALEEEEEAAAAAAAAEAAAAGDIALAEAPADES